MVRFPLCLAKPPTDDQTVALEGNTYYVRTPCHILVLNCFSDSVITVAIDQCWYLWSYRCVYWCVYSSFSSSNPLLPISAQPCGQMQRDFL